MKKILSIMLYTSMAITASSAEMRLTFQSVPEFRFEEGGNTLELCYIPASQEVKTYTLLDSSVNLLKSDVNYYEIKGISSNIETLCLDISDDINVKLSCDIDNLKVKGKAISLGGERRFRLVESESPFFEISTGRPVYVDDKCWCHPSGFVKFKDDLDMQVNTADLAERKEMLTKRANMEQYQEDLYYQILGEEDISDKLQQWKGGLTKRDNDYDVNDFLTQLNSLAGELLGGIECPLCKSFMDNTKRTLQNENTVTWKQIADIVDSLCKVYKCMSDIDEKAMASNYTVEEINQLKGKHIQLTQSVSQLDEFIKQRQDKTYDFTTMAGTNIKVTSNQILKAIAKTNNTEEINTIRGIIAGAKDNELIDIVQQTNANRKPNPTEYNLLIIPNQITTIKQMMQTLETEMMHYTPKPNIDKDKDKEIALLQTEIERLKREVEACKVKDLTAVKGKLSGVGSGVYDLTKIFKKPYKTPVGHFYIKDKSGALLFKYRSWWIPAQHVANIAQILQTEIPIHITQYSHQQYKQAQLLIRQYQQQVLSKDITAFGNHDANTLKTIMLDMQDLNPYNVSKILIARGEIKAQLK